MSRSYGSVSSLLSSAQAAYNKTAAVNDQIQALQWKISAKDQSAYDAYTQYLQTRAAQTKTTNPSQNISLQGLLVDTQRSFTSAQIARAGDQVNLGNISNRDKLAQIGQLAQQAAQNGDANLAQSLSQKYDTLTMTIQNQEAAAKSAGEAASTKAYTAYKGGITDAIAAQTAAVDAAKVGLKAGLLTKDQFVTATAQAINNANAAHAAAAKDPNLTAADKATFAKAAADFTSQNSNFIGKNGNLLIHDTALVKNTMDQYGNINAGMADTNGFHQITSADPSADSLGLRGTFAPTATVPGAVKTSDALKKLGVSTSVEIGGVVRPVYANDPANPQFAYTVDPNTGLHYLVNKNGTVELAQDTTQNNGIATDNQIAAYRQKNGLGGFGAQAGETGAQRNDRFSKNLSLVSGDIGKIAGGAANFLTGGLAGNSLSYIAKLGQIGQLKKQADAKAQADALAQQQSQKIANDQLNAARAAAASQAQQADYQNKLAQSYAQGKGTIGAPSDYTRGSMQAIANGATNNGAIAAGIGTSAGLKLPGIK